MLHDDIAAALPELRAHALSLMVDSCTITRRRLDEDGEPVREMDPVTLELTDVWDEVWAGRCRVQRPGAVMVGREPVVGGAEYNVETVHVQVPLSVLGVKADDRVTVTAVGAISDPDSVGMVLSVRVNQHKTHATKRVLVCEEVSS
nr:MAG TPA_asm: head closure knob [Caudoviricetes sp.]